MYAVPKLLMRHLPRHYPFVSRLELMSKHTLIWSYRTRSTAASLSSLPRRWKRAWRSKKLLIDTRTLAPFLRESQRYWTHSLGSSMSSTILVDSTPCTSWKILEMATGFCSCLMKLPSKVWLYIFGCGYWSSFWFKRHQADKIMASLCLNDIQRTLD